MSNEIENVDTIKFITDEEFEKIINDIDTIRNAINGLNKFDFKKNKMSKKQYTSIGYKLFYLRIFFNEEFTGKERSYLYKILPNKLG
jgi:hypothetical protein